MQGVGRASSQWRGSVSMLLSETRMRSDLLLAVVFVLVFLYGVYHVARWAQDVVEVLPL